MDQNEQAYFGAGCFWNGQKIYDQQHGVIETEVGWCEVPLNDPEGGQKTTRVEVVRVIFAPSQNGLKNLIDLFWSTHNPESSKNLDETYIERSVLIYKSQTQKEIMEEALSSKIIEYPDTKTVVLPFISFLRAPEKDQKYYMR